MPRRTSLKSSLKIFSHPAARHWRCCMKGGTAAPSACMVCALIEWETDLPDLQVLLSEAAQARPSVRCGRPAPIAELICHDSVAWLARNLRHQHPPLRGDLAQWGDALPALLDRACPAGRLPSPGRRGARRMGAARLGTGPESGQCGGGDQPQRDRTCCPAAAPHLGVLLAALALYSVGKGSVHCGSLKPRPARWLPPGRCNLHLGELSTIV